MRKLIALAFVAAAVSANAATSFGMVDCGVWVKAQSGQDRWWLGGYISGLNAALVTSGAPDPLDAISIQQLYLWVDNYCRANPLHNLSKAANTLYQELDANAKAQRK